MSKNTTLAVFTAASFLAAFLMFAVQPMVGKMLLPLVGGTPAGWVVAMAFFQLALLAGYLLAHLLSTFTARSHGALFLMALSLGVFFLPVSLKDQAAVLGAIPTPFTVFALLSLTVAVPFIALSLSAPTIQRLFSSTGHPDAKDPYFLYVASNLGSFAGLFAYPLMIEPLMKLSVQMHSWMGGFAVLISLACFATATLSKQEERKASKAPKESITWSRRLRWLALAFVPSSLMLGVTSHITMDILSVPMVWVVPLGIYLLTFVAAFSKKRLVSLQFLQVLHPFVVALALGFVLFLTHASWMTLLPHLAFFGIIALFCHQLLSDDRPSVAHLTEYYLIMSAGGALGGAFNAFLMPTLLDFQLEYQLTLLLSCLLNPAFGKAPTTKSWLLLVAAVTGALILYAVKAMTGLTLTQGLLPVFFILCLVLASSQARLALLCGAYVIFMDLAANHAGQMLYRDRNFFGIVKVTEKQKTHEDKIYDMRLLAHGTTIHGVQYFTKELEREPTAYFTRQGQLGDVFRALKPKSVGVAGLGIGTISCHLGKNASLVFYEIDPAIVYAAKNYFTYLDKCAPEKNEIIVGDARLELAKRDQDRYDLLILDAFSSDMVPVHLMTIEAFQLYLERIKPDGAIVFNLSNRFYELKDLVAANAAKLGLQNLQLKKDAPVWYGAASNWMILSRTGKHFPALKNAGWQEITAPAGMKPWTDEYSHSINLIRLWW